MTLKRAFLIFFSCSILIIPFWINRISHKPNSVWIYASIYKEVIAEFDEALKSEYPDISIFWYQSGSENVAARVNAELSAGTSQAQIIMTSDPFWYLELKQNGHLLPYFSPLADRLPSHYRDPEGAFVINRLPVGIIAFDKSVISKEVAPKSWKDLTQSNWKNRITMPSPLESGTATTFLVQLVRRMGWDYFKGLKSNGLLAAGGNSAVIQRIENKEIPLGIVLLENALQAKKRGAPIEVVYPAEGVILVPSPIAILSGPQVTSNTKKVYDFFLTDKAQEIFVKYHVYSPIRTELFPEGAKTFAEIEKTALPWDAKILEELQETKDINKKRFTDLIIK